MEKSTHERDPGNVEGLRPVFSEAAMRSRMPSSSFGRRLIAVGCRSERRPTNWLTRILTAFVVYLQNLQKVSVDVHFASFDVPLIIVLADPDRAHRTDVLTPPPRSNKARQQGVRENASATALPR
jgi:hypothetical protein